MRWVFQSRFPLTTRWGCLPVPPKRSCQPCPVPLVTRRLLIGVCPSFTGAGCLVASRGRHHRLEQALSMHFETSRPQAPIPRLSPVTALLQSHRRGPILDDDLGHGAERHERFLTGSKLGNHKAASRESQSCIADVRLVFVVTV